MTLVGVQLWTLRDRLDDPGALFDGLAAVGVEAVEPFGLGDPSLDATERMRVIRELRSAADAAGLRILSTHTHLPSPDGEAAFFDEMAELGVELAVAAVPESLAPFGREAFATAESIAAYAARMNALAETAAGHGLRIGYHNHAWEWNELPEGGLAYDRLWRELSPRVVAEVDVLWATVAGQDAVEIVERLGDRVRLLHAGDASPITNVEHQLAAGDGDSPLRAALAAAAGHLEAVFVEATTPPPGVTALELVERSAAWLRSALAETHPIRTL